MPHKRSTTSISPARQAAFDALCRVEADEAYASVLLAALPKSGLSRDDRALATEITLGVLRRQKTLDHLIERYSGRPVDRLDLPVLVALRIGLYQLRHLSRIPPSASVNESVNLVKMARVRSAAGLVNAVLRGAATRINDSVGDGIVDPIERLSVEVSHPRWLLERWIARFGQADAEALSAANNQSPPQAFRINGLRERSAGVLGRLDAQGRSAQSSRYVPGARIVEGRMPPLLIEAAEEGLIYFQDEASQLITLLLDPKPGDRVLDLCAAPGSKTSHIASLTNNQSEIVACDIHQHRLTTVRSTCNRLGVAGVELVALDGESDLPFTREVKFDLVLVDAPCTGTGTLRRNPEIKWRLRPDDPGRMSKVQLALMNGAARALSVGGRLVYSTCSIEPEENEAVIGAFLETHPQFRLVRPNAHPDLIEGSLVKTYPHRHGMDGFVAAVLERVCE